LLNALSQSSLDTWAAAIGEVISSVQQAWSVDASTEVKTLTDSLIGGTGGTASRPAFYQQIERPEIREAFELCAADDGWWHPGFLMAGDTVARFTTAGARRTPAKARRQVQTWLLLVIPGDAGEQNKLARFTVERVPGGAGLLIPSGRAVPYLRMGSAFWQGLLQGWWAAYELRRRRGQPLVDYDYRFTIDLADVHRSRPDRPLEVLLNGRSAEVAIACALAALDQPTDLDPRAAITACFQRPFTDDLSLQRVDGLLVKTLPAELAAHRIDRVVVAQDQPQRELQVIKEVDLSRANKFRKALQWLTQDHRWTSRVRRDIRRKATAHLVALCGPKNADRLRDGQQFVMPPLVERIERDDGQAAMERALGREVRAEGRTLPPPEVHGVLLGEWRAATQVPANPTRQDGKRTGVPRKPRAPRLALFAHSGQGKTLLLVVAERRIARQPGSDKIPLRVGKTLSELRESVDLNWVEDWRAGSTRILRSLFDRLILERLPKSERRSSQAKQLIWKWFLRCVRQGRVVLLLDAVDQSERALTGLGEFLSCEELRECPVLMTGRPEALQNHPEAWQANQWTKLKLEKFTATHQRQFLGSQLAAQLLPHEAELNWKTDAAERRRHGWKDLLEVPLLLRLLRDLARDGVLENEEIRSRYSLYQAAVKHLFEQGWKSLEKTKQLRSGNFNRIRADRVLGSIAWFSVSHHDFSAKLVGEQYEDATQKIWRRWLPLLNQVNLISAFSLLDDVRQERLEWRHRSILEFFAGCRLGTREPQDQTRGVKHISTEERRRVLAEVHAVNVTAHTQGSAEVITQQSRRRDDWQETLRFALCHAAQQQPSWHNQLALELIELSNPWVVYESIEQDAVEFQEEVRSLVLWLVHRDDNVRREYREAWKGRGNKPSAADCSIVNQVDLTRIWDVATRDSACLIPAAEIVHGFDADESDPAGWLSKVSITFEQDRQVVESPIWKEFQRQFVEIPPQRFDAKRFHPKVDFTGLGVGNPQAIPIGVDRRLEMADFLVTNELWELFEPGHRRWRTQINADNKSPVVNVNWYMAQAFCAWLTAQDVKWEYGLPTEWEWEAVVRWQQTPGGAHVTTPYWWGDDPQWQRHDGTRFWLMNCYQAGLNKTNRRDEAIQRHKDAGLWHPSKPAGTGDEKLGILDLHGNVDEWCANEYSLGGSPLRVRRGGSWDDLVINTEVSSRYHHHAARRGRFIGLRVVRRARVSPAVLKADL
jgi:formylglycine-generating enzyme required for sulfatase activity